LYANVGRMRADAAMEVVTPNLGVLRLEVGQEISVGKKVPVLCRCGSCAGQQVRSLVSRDSCMTRYPDEIDFTVLKMH